MGGKDAIVSEIKADGKSDRVEATVRVYDVPPFGYKVFWIGKEHFMNDSVEGVINAEKTGKTLLIGNGILRLSVDKQSGCITSLIDEHSGFEYIAGGKCGNQLQAFKDTPKDYDAWNIDPGTYDVPPALLDKADSVEE